ncbi:DUF397 domain-containing protein [Spirillospora sp. CA-128828]|uniref:DUF397 domain-containing protein n=1 Tax=Spirillospora sp. CA-128828 TaxID=3240033 RepID=UPI003D90B40D
MDLSSLDWRKSSRSNESGDNCVELAAVVTVVALRDSKDPDGPKIILARSDFRHFVKIIRNL